MKRITLLLPALLLQLLLHAQDTLLMGCDQVIIGKITDINDPHRIVYKRADQPNGPDYFQKKKEVRLIKFQGGTVHQISAMRNWSLQTDVSGRRLVNPHFEQAGFGYAYNGRPVSSHFMFHIMEQQHDPELKPLILKARINQGVQYVGLASIPIAVVDAFLFLLEGDTHGMDDPGQGPTKQTIRTQYIFAGVAVGLAATGITCKIRYSQLKRKAISVYNQKY